MSKLNGIMLAACLTLVPGVASAEVSLSDVLDVDTTLSLDAMDLDLDLNSDDADVAHCGGHRCHTTVVHEGTRRVVRHRRVVRRPIRPVVVVEQPPAVVVAAPAVQTVATTEPVEERRGSKFGFGIRGAGFKQTAAEFVNGGEFGMNISGGIGYYLKYRPIRWVSIEFQNDFMFGSFEQTVGPCYKEFSRVPLSLGLRVHVFDYGMFDLYAAAAGSVAFMTLDDGNDHRDQEIRYPQFGGQIGVGASFIAGVFEIGLDVRYTIEEAPDGDERRLGQKIKQSDPSHGVLFSVNVGLAI